MIETIYGAIAQLILSSTYARQYCGRVYRGYGDEEKITDIPCVIVNVTNGTSDDTWGTDGEVMDVEVIIRTKRENNANARSAMDAVMGVLDDQELYLPDAYTCSMQRSRFDGPRVRDASFESRLTYELSTERHTMYPVTRTA